MYVATFMRLCVSVTNGFKETKARLADSPVVRSREGQRFLDGGMLHHHLLDLKGRNSLSALVDDFLRATADEQITARVQVALATV